MRALGMLIIAAALVTVGLAGQAAAPAKKAIVLERDKFMNNTNEKIRDLARLASINYNQSYTNE